MYGIRRTQMSGILGFGLVLIVLFSGCGGHGDGNNGGSSGGGTVVEQYVVPVGEQRALSGNLTVQCKTATIAGQLVAGAPGLAGGDGVSVTIVSEGDITVAGSIVTGAGAVGASARASGNDGGDGGDLKLVSKNGSITIGAASQAAALHAKGIAVRQSGTAVLQSGNGGNGTEGVLGGAGGAGGDISLEAPNGTLTINEQPNLFQVGNGGNGGRALIDDANAGVAFPETLPNGGGDSGQILINCKQLAGVQGQDTGLRVGGRTVWFVALAQGVGAGGVGGDAGDCYYGVDPGSKNAIWQAPQGAIPETVRIQGAAGGAGLIRGGRGGSVYAAAAPVSTVATSAHTTKVPTPFPAPSVKARGGNGGSFRITRVQFGEGGLLPLDTNILVCFSSQDQCVICAGAGGDAVANGASGSHGAPGGGDGGLGGSASAIGGDAGAVDLSALPEWLRSMFLVVIMGGGDAYAGGGSGGYGGDGEVYGGDGGSGGNAEAYGGRGTVSLPEATEGNGGDATANAGWGGSGGAGVLGGKGGSKGTATAVAGAGDPPGQTYVHPGFDGTQGPTSGSYE